MLVAFNNGKRMIGYATTMEAIGKAGEKFLRKRPTLLKTIKKAR